mgnify:CR=1 FL=1
MGFKFFPTLKVAVFAGLEIAEAQGNRARSHGLSHLAEPFGKGFDNLFRMTRLQKIKRMFMDIGRPDEFLTHEANAVAGQAGVFIGKGRITQIHVDLGSRYRKVSTTAAACAGAAAASAFFT